MVAKVRAFLDFLVDEFNQARYPGMQPTALAEELRPKELLRSVASDVADPLE